MNQWTQGHDIDDNRLLITENSCTMIKYVLYKACCTRCTYLTDCTLNDVWW